MDGVLKKCLHSGSCLGTIWFEFESGGTSFNYLSISLSIFSKTDDLIFMIFSLNLL